MSRIPFHELTLETIGQWPAAVKTGLLIGLSSLIVIMGYCLVIHSNFISYKELQAQEIALKADFEIKQRQMINLDAYRHQLFKLKEQFTSLLKYLPTENELYGLLEEISKTGMVSGLKFLLFAPQPEEVHGFYTILPIKISIEGDYFQLASFLRRIVTMERIVTFHDFRIKGGLSRCNQPACEDVLVMNVTAKVYRYRTQ
ncbi:type 4a pilus biogenesis protein PilO [Legionella lytica]|uniref:Type 4a pilus biogenesis protein PilO n=1 Tax=Legionella lytica TaxID=96232 RepID=A0ABY4Y6P4_9GAMM|nr:type 4a pilus biogenesis protein PilO [Legionella lytica]USQ13305.1 type 4a pilus biogenesis protein PilO [Legionella lytica]